MFWTSFLAGMKTFVSSYSRLTLTIKYADAPIEGIHRVLEIALGTPIPRGMALDTSAIEVICQGTTIATNALLERKDIKSALLITKGFKDLLLIDNQSRPALFNSNIKKPGWGTRSALDAELPENHVRGVSGDVVQILKCVDEAAVLCELRTLWNEGFRSTTVVLTHSYTFPDHELAIAPLARHIDFEHVSVSATADAYLTPHIRTYLDGFAHGRGFADGLDSVRVEFMQSDGGLVNHKALSGLCAILSGPTGGVVGYARTSYSPEDGVGCIGFDMGDASTNVSHYAGALEHVFETVTAGVTIQVAQCDINTYFLQVASGGGPMLFWKNGLSCADRRVQELTQDRQMFLGMLYKGRPRTFTDANLFLGRIQLDYFSKIFGPNKDQSLDVEVTRRKFAELTAIINKDTGGSKTPKEVASRFLAVANESMACPIRSLSEGRGCSLKNLASFGGAGGQHACLLARILGINTIMIHKYSSVLSTYGMALADVVSEQTMPASEIWGTGGAEECLQKRIRQS
ncbi:hypothetical protein FISHEDRAFT_68624 [Fistulina hepatica ATCC 64428]|uniref:Hydantoinase/oxoprolinase n=1 Tax=Fistulina hepatica ATCC 64428 TaxID=1128425 RepID=A0A0D7APL7_9AGAR|nr:hypothetical protein FISHEDRAFT_68624 [Fistulina hepatica ATCC 64428]